MTKRELAESLTVEQLRELAAEEGIDITGLTLKADLVDAIVAGTTVAVIQAKADASAATAETTPTTATREETTMADTTMPEDTSIATTGGEEPLGLREPLGPQPPEEEEVELVPRLAEDAGVTPEEQAENRTSPADLELAIPPIAEGAQIRTKVNPETPSPQQVDAAVGITSGPPVTSVTVTDAEGNEVVNPLTPDDAALISQRQVATNRHPAHLSAGHYANPGLREMTDEEKEADREAYASRFG